MSFFGQFLELDNFACGASRLRDLLTFHDFFDFVKL